MFGGTYVQVRWKQGEWFETGPPHELELTAVRRYRTQEVAGSSPASSIRESPAHAHPGKRLSLGHHD
jgi:hypothetical protein